MHNDMDYELHDICEMRNTLICWAKDELSKGRECVDTSEFGQVADIIKDLAEAEEKLHKGTYYQEVTKAMQEYGDEEHEGSYGYNNRRYASGRYAPAGRGHISGYRKPHPDMWKNDYEDYINDPMMAEHHYRMGYVDKMDPMHKNEDWDPRYGKSYNDYMKSKRHYTQTSSQADKDAMATHANEHINDSIMTVKEIWQSASPDLKKKMKADFTKLVSEMTI